MGSSIRSSLRSSKFKWIKNMKITPLEIRQKEFQKTLFKGYEKEEVDAYLFSLSQAWERVMDENRELSRRLEIADKEVSRLRDVESGLVRTLKSAEETGNNIVEQSRQRAELHLREAQMTAESMMSDVRFKAKTIAEDAEMELKKLTDALKDKVRAMEKEYLYIESQRDHIAHGVKDLVNEIQERVQRSLSRTDRSEFQAKLQEIRQYVNEKVSSINIAPVEPAPLKPLVIPEAPAAESKPAPAPPATPIPNPSPAPQASAPQAPEPKPEPKKEKN